MTNSKGLTSKTVTAFYWTLSRGSIVAILRIIVTAVLARLLFPKDFGITQAATVITGFVEVFAMIGVGPALIQFKKIDGKHISTALFFSVFLGVLLGLFIFFLASPISLFFKIPELENVLKFICLIFPINSVSTVSNNLLKRELMYKEIAKVEIVSFVIGYGLISISLALCGFEYWSLIIAMFVQVVLQSVGFLYYQPHALSISFDRDTVKSILSFGGGITMAKIFNYFAIKGDYFIVGRWLGDSALGVYGRSYNIMNSSVTLFGQAMDKILFSAMSRKQDENSKLMKAYLIGSSLVSIILIPLSVFLILVSHELIQLLLGQKWLSAVVPLQILLVGMYFRVNYKVNGALIRSKGHVYKLAWVQGVYALVIILGTYGMVYAGFGVNGVSAAVTFGLITHYFLMTLITKKILTELSFGTISKFLLYPLIKSLIAGSIVFFIISELRSLNLNFILILVISGAIYFLQIGLMMKYFTKLFVSPESLQALKTMNEYFPEKFGIRKFMQF